MNLMSRYFLEVAYDGTGFSGFQIQQNAITVQSEIEKAIQILLRQPVQLTGSSRTDAGVHAYQNYFHFDVASELPVQFVYKLNAILPSAIAVIRHVRVPDHAHCRFDAVSREYGYHIYTYKNPFLVNRAYYYPYRLSIDKLQQAAELLKAYQDFTSFSKRNTQVKSFRCNLYMSEWEQVNGQLVYKVKANRFLRGMVRALTATMLKVGREKMQMDEFRGIIELKDCTRASFAVPAHGLFLKRVNYPATYLETF
jgi:tRNA pseudouridine38-40 synthase